MRKKWKMFFSKKHILKKSIVIFFVFSLNNFGYGQEFSKKTVIVGEDTFLPYLKGKVVNGIDQNAENFQKIFSLLQSQPSVSKPQGYEVDAYSNETNRLLEIYFIPYLSESGEVVRAKAGSCLKFFLNDITALWQPINVDIPDIYFAPDKSGDFMGYPVYKQDDMEKTMIYKGNATLFLPVSREEYLSALIKSEENKLKQNDTPKSSSEIFSEIQKTYSELLKTDKVAAEEFKKQMDSFKNDLSESNATENLATSYRKELARLSPSERKKQAYYSVYAMEKYGNFSGLVPEGEEGNATALVKPNDKVVQKHSHKIQLITLTWNLITPTQSENVSPRLYLPKNNFGYELTNNKIYELYNNQNLWKEIIGLVK